MLVAVPGSCLLRVGPALASPGMIRAEAAADTGPQDIFLVDGAPPVRVVFALSDQSCDGPALDTAMGKALAGVLEVESGQRTSSTLQRLVEAQTRPRADEAIDRRICVAWLYGESDTPKRVELGQTRSGWLLARELDAKEGAPTLARLDERRFELLSKDWPALRAMFDAPPGSPRGELVELPQPYVASSVELDSATLRQRIYGRNPTGVHPLSRELSEEQVFLRMPKELDRRRPAGLLVWIHAIDSPQPPLNVIAPACDELGLVIASIANAGNSRDVVNRLQLVLDAVATVSERVPIDPSRVYLTGISGGGRCSSILWSAFPDVFTGAVPIVGLDSYQAAPTGTGQAWAPAFVQPGGSRFALLRKHRLAAISGEADQNFTEMSVRIDGLLRDGLDVRLVHQPGMGHEMCAQESFAEALHWVDEPAQEAFGSAAERAGELLERAKRESGEQRTRLLERAMETAPWSDPAWEAYELLKGP